MKDFFIVNEKGRIVRTGVAPREIALQQAQYKKERVFFGIANQSTHYFFNEELVERPLMAIEQDSLKIRVGESVSLTGVPQDAAVNIGGIPVLVDKGKVCWEGSNPGNFLIFIEAFPYQDTVLSVEVTED